MHRTVTVSLLTGLAAVALTACFGIAGGVLKEAANTHVITTGLRPAEFDVINRGAQRHGCTYVDRTNLTTVCDRNHENCVTAVNYACPELPAKNPIGCRVEGDEVRCACTGKESVCDKLIADVVAEGRAP